MYDIVVISTRDQDDPHFSCLKQKFSRIKFIRNFVDLEDAYNKAKRMCFTKMFWIIWDDLFIADDFNFEYKADEWSEDIVHVFLNQSYYDGVCLIPKKKSIAKKQLEYRFFQEKKEINLCASRPRPYDIIFISYDEPNADKNYNHLCIRFPTAKRIHKVKGIHRAHIEAAKISNTEMFWVVDGDAVVLEDFNFNFQVPKWHKDNVYVWRSINPINQLVYGYGGIKLFPKKETLEMDTSKADMTTSISSKFNPVHDISNITEFNTDPFNTWKSAFRECAKLSSRVIRGQVDAETEYRLETWCTVGKDKPFGEYAISGANAGKEFGENNKSDITLINNFDWLHEQFSKHSLG